MTEKEFIEHIASIGYEPVVYTRGAFVNEKGKTLLTTHDKARLYGEWMTFEDALRKLGLLSNEPCGYCGGSGYGPAPNPPPIIMNGRSDWTCAGCGSGFYRGQAVNVFPKGQMYHDRCCIRFLEQRYKKAIAAIKYMVAKEKK